MQRDCGWRVSQGVAPGRGLSIGGAVVSTLRRTLPDGASRSRSSAPSEDSRALRASALWRPRVTTRAAAFACGARSPGSRAHWQHPRQLRKPPSWPATVVEGPGRRGDDQGRQGGVGEGALVSTGIPIRRQSVMSCAEPPIGLPPVLSSQGPRPGRARERPPHLRARLRAGRAPGGTRRAPISGAGRRLVRADRPLSPGRPIWRSASPGL